MSLSHLSHLSHLPNLPNLPYLSHPGTRCTWVPAAPMYQTYPPYLSDPVWLGSI